MASGVDHIGKARGRAASPPLAACEEALAAHDGRRRLMARTLDWLTLFTPAAAAVFYGVDARLRISVAHPFVYKLSPPGLLDPLIAYRDYERLYRDLDPLSPRALADGDATVVGVEDAGGLETFAETRFAREYLAPLRLGAVTSIFLRDERRIVAVITLVRRLGEAGPSRAQLQFLRRSQPLLEAAHLVAQRSATDDPRELLRTGGLTEREIEVALLVASGARNEEIARTLTVTEATVKTHLHRIFAKLGVRSRTQLALQLGPTATFG